MTGADQGHPYRCGPCYHRTWEERSAERLTTERPQITERTSRAGALEEQLTGAVAIPTIGAFKDPFPLRHLLKPEKDPQVPNPIRPSSVRIPELTTNTVLGLSRSFKIVFTQFFNTFKFHEWTV